MVESGHEDDDSDGCRARRGGDGRGGGAAAAAGVPRRPLTDDEKDAVARAFSFDRAQIDLAARAFEAYLRDAFGEDPVR